jgi:hypothetical protein
MMNAATGHTPLPSPTGNFHNDFERMDTGSRERKRVKTRI